MFVNPLTSFFWGVCGMVDDVYGWCGSEVDVVYICSSLGALILWSSRNSEIRLLRRGYMIGLQKSKTYYREECVVFLKTKD
jgi:hypothetical protein